MSQDPLATASGSGLAVRTGINDAIARLASKASGVSRPSDIAVFESWIETDNPGTGIGTLWLWDGTADIFVGLVNTAAHTFIGSSVLTTQGDMLYRGASADARLGAAADAFKGLFSGGAGANPGWAGTWKVLGELVSGGASALDITAIPADVNHLMLLFRALPATDAVTLRMRTAGADGNFNTGSTDYNFAASTVLNSGAGANTGGSSGSPYVDLSLTSDVSNDGNAGGVCGSLLFTDIQAATYTRGVAHCSYQVQGSGGYRFFTGDAVRMEADRITGVRLFASSGNLSGRVLALGCKN